MAGHRPMSIDAMLDMERKDVLKALEGRSADGPSSPSGQRSPSPYAGASQSPGRSMLDIEEEPAEATQAPATQAPVRSMLDVGDSNVATQAPVRSMLDVDSPPTPSSPRGTTSGPTSPNEPLFRPHSSPFQGSHHARSSSDASFRPADFGFRAGSRPDRVSEYQFSGIPSYAAPSSSRRLPQSGSSRRMGSGALGDPFSRTDLSSLQLPSDAGRNPAPSGRLSHAQSISPHERWAARSRSPNALQPGLPPNQTLLGDGRVLNMKNAYRRLSDANLALSQGSLSQLPMRTQSTTTDGPLFKDYVGPDGEHLESSDEDETVSSDDEDRGRKTAPRSLNPETHEQGDHSASGSRPDHLARPSLSLLAAADEERSRVAALQSQTHTYRSLLEPESKGTTSGGETTKSSKGKKSIHPNTSYDQNPTSGSQSVVDSDDEADMDDIKRAQKLEVSMTNILTAPESHRSIRIIYRGDYNKIVQTADVEPRRLRKYLAATDLSEESTHALEWAIGTVLRDGDTLIAMYCVDEETGIAVGENSLVPDDPGAMKEQAAAINTVANAKGVSAPVLMIGEHKKAAAFQARMEAIGVRTPGSSPGPSSRGDAQKAAEERQQAVLRMTDSVLRLLRKTRLQVRIIVEVVHCKNPRHLITEVIDLINPTLVVIGSRGRSALKGVILGSFSNYLVTKSSVPVMVARKKLRKQSKGNKRTAEQMIQQVNHLNNPAARSLVNAKVD